MLKLAALFPFAPACAPLPPAGRVLILAPHPDDAVFGCGAALLAHAAQGDPVRVLVMSSGELQAPAGVVQREVESSAAARVLGLESAPEFWRLPDGALAAVSDLDLRLLAVLTDWQAELLYLPSPWETHPDHQALCRAALQAVRQATKAPMLAFYEVGQPLQPNSLLDCSALMSRKSAAMACFASQQGVQEYQRQIEGLNQFRSYAFGQPAVHHAEAFLRLVPAQLPAFLDYLHAQPAPLGALPAPLAARASVTVLIRSSQRSTLVRALQSLAGQTCDKVTALVVNTLPEPHPQLPELSLDMRLLDPGAALSRPQAANALLNAASGDYLLFLDDDDYLRPTHLEELVRALEADPALVFAHSGTRMIDGAGNTLRHFNAEPDLSRLLSGNLFPIHSVLFRRERAAGLRFDPELQLYEDWLFWIELARRGPAVRVPVETAIYVQSASGSGVADPRQQQHYRELVYRKALATLDLTQYQALLARVQAEQALQEDVAALRAQLADAKAREEAAREAHERLTGIAQTRLEHIRQLQEVADTRLVQLTALPAVAQERLDLVTRLQQLASSSGEREQQLANTCAALATSNAALTTTCAEREQQLASMRAALTATNVALIAEEQAHQQLQQDHATLHIRHDEQAQRLALTDQELQWTLQHFSAVIAAHNPELLAQCQTLWPALGEAAARDHLRAIVLARSTRDQRLLRYSRRAYRLLREPWRVWQRSTPRARMQVAQQTYGGKTGVLRKVTGIVRERGLRAVWQSYRIFPQRPPLGAEISPQTAADPAPRSNYQCWIEQFDALTPERAAQARAILAGWTSPPLISIVMPVYNTAEAWLRAALDSVQAQVYPHWELCIADDASTQSHIATLLHDYAAADTRIKLVFRPLNGHICAASNSALALARGDFVALMDNDDELHPLALFHVAAALIRTPDAQLLYSDEDKIGPDGCRRDPYFKPDWNPDLFLSQNYFSHLGVFRRSLLLQVDGFRAGLEGSQDYDLVLRCLPHVNPEQIVHIPHVLYHWRIIPGSTAAAGNEKPYAFLAALRAVQDYLDGQRIAATVGEAAPGMHMLRVRYALPARPPRVSILIPTRNAEQLVRQCIESVVARTTYPDYEIILIDNGSDEPSALAYFDTLASAGTVRLLRDESPFNYSALNNSAAAQAQGEVLCLLNNDIEVISPDWLEEMVSHALRPGIGAVGARLWYPNDTLQHGGVIVGFGGVAGHAHHGLPPGDPGYFGRAWLLQNYSAVTAACLVVRKALYEEVGGLNATDLKVAFNDVDFCLHLHEAGYRNLWTPYAELYHHESATRGSDMEPAKYERFVREVRYMETRCAALLACDPAYNPNLALTGATFTLSQTPRVQPLA